MMQGENGDGGIRRRGTVEMPVFTSAPTTFRLARSMDEKRKKNKLLQLFYHNVALAKGLKNTFYLTRGILSKVYLLLCDLSRSRKKENEHCAANKKKKGENISDDQSSSKGS